VGRASACSKTFAAKNWAVMQLISPKAASVEEQCNDILAHYRESIDKTEGVVLSRFYKKLHESPEQSKVAIAALVNSTHFHDLKPAVINASNGKECSESCSADL
jgi:predicted methyltransferase